MSLIEGFLEFMTNTLPGAAIDVTMGRGADGVPYSSAENFVRPDAGKPPDIHIHGNINDNRKDQEAAPAQEPEKPAPVQETAEEWFHRIRDEAVHHAAEQRAAEDISNGREQALYAVAVDPVGHYAQRDADEAAFYQAKAQQEQQEQEQHQYQGHKL